MKINFIKLLLFLSGLYLLLIVFFSRQVYQVEKDKYITVWKRVGGDCYIMPYRYYGLTLPEDNFIKTYNKSNFEFFFLNNSPQILIIRTDDSYEYHNRNSNFKLIKYEDKWSNRIFKNNFENYQKGVNRIFINIKESYAIDSSGIHIDYSMF